MNSHPPSIPTAQTFASWVTAGTGMLLVVAFICNLFFGQKQDSSDTAILKTQMVNLNAQVSTLNADLARVEGKLDVLVGESQRSQVVTVQPGKR